MNRSGPVVGRSARLVRGNVVDVETACAAGLRPGEPSAGSGRIQGEARGAVGMPTIAGRRGFTLVELLVVIMIIGLIAAISVPVVMQSLAKARNAAIKAEIDMLHMAIMNYKNEYGSFPPCIDSIPPATGLVAKHIQRAFPRAAYMPDASLVTPETSLFFWLTGYTQNPIDPRAINDPTLPFSRLFDFDRARVSANMYAPPQRPGSVYLYFPAPTYPASVVTPRVVNGSTYSAQPRTDTEFFNPDTFQILCAGRDGVFDNDDDLSNFWPGTRREYLDSLK